MAPISLKIVLDEGAVTRKVKFDTTDTVAKAYDIVKDKVIVEGGKDYGLFLRSVDDTLAGVWLERQRTLDYYMLRDGDSLDYICKIRNLRVRMLDGTVKTMQVDQSKTIANLMFDICSRLGIINHDEYGLCREEVESSDDKELKAGNTATLTKNKGPPRERDQQLEQLSKILKTDDNVLWLDHHKTLREAAVEPTETLLLKRRLFYSDRNVDSRDPVQLNLLYVQTRDAILNGRHPVTEDQAVEFAGIQCQIHFDDFHEEKHKPGYIENLAEFLPEQYAGSWGVEKKILKAYRAHQGLNQLEAKCLYIKTARDLPTYGVTFFLVKEKQKNKKKLVPRLLGINAESILRLDENTKEILQVWPLTQVKTYHVGKSETFTLNFGDYSDKEYSVKTQDAYRIRDILEGYIDLIRKRILAGPDNLGSESAVIVQDNVEASRGNIIHIVSNNPSKVVEQSFVGPSKLIPYANEMNTGQGTQIVTVQQMVVTGMVNNPQQAVKGEVPMRSDMSMESIRRLNRLNSQSVVLVGLLSEPDEDKIREAQRTVDTINSDIMPVLVEGLHKSAQKQSTEESKKKMLDELQELSDYVQQLTHSIKIEPVKPKEAEETAMKIANLTTQMYAELDPKTKRRSDLLRRSRRSFIVDEKMDSSLRRASFIAAATTALHVLDDAQKNISQPYAGPPLDKTQVEDTEKSALDKLGKLNAAIALYLSAHTDPKIIDYSTAVTSMNTIKELMPELANDAQALGSVRDNKSRQQLLDGIRALCDSTRTICTLTGAEDHEKMQDASNKYADVSRKLIFTIGKGVDKATEAEILKLAKNACDKAVMLQKAGNDVAKAKGVDAKEIQDAGQHVVTCGKDLVACAKITAPCPHEAHGRSALLAAAAGTAAAARALLHRAAPAAATAAPACDKLHARAADLDIALEAINEACSKLEDADAKANAKAEPEPDAKPKSPEEILRLQIVKTITVAKDKLHAADDELNKPLTSTMMNLEDAEKQKLQLAKKIAQINAAMASFVSAYSDREKPDRATAELALRTITELVPEVARDAKTLSASMDPDSRNQFLQQIQALCQASKDVCATAETEGVNAAVRKFSNASEKLVFTLTPREDGAKGQQMLDLASSACDKASQLLSNVHQLANIVEGVNGQDLDCKGVRVVDKAQALLAAAQVTAPTITEPRCQSSLLSTVDDLSSSSQQLADSWRKVPPSPYHQPLETELQELEKILDKMRKGCQSPPPGATKMMMPMVSPQEMQRLKYVRTVSRAKKNLQAADDELNKPDICLLMRQEDADKMQKQLQQRLEELNAAVAALLATSQDRSNPDYVATEEAVSTISELVPQVAKDSKTLSSSMDAESRDKFLAKVRALCDASKDVCSSAESGKGLEPAASKFADASGRLAFTISPKSGTSNEQQVVDLSSAACDKAAQLLFNVQQLSQQVGGDAGEHLDRKGVDVCNSAQAILVASQNWGPNISDPRARSELLSAVDSLSSSGQDLAKNWRQVPKGPRHQVLEKDLQELEKILGQLRGACESAADDQVKKVAEVKRLQFVKSAADAKRNLQAADDELNKPVIPAPLNQEDVVNKQHRLHQHLEDLNAAIAALMASTADSSRPDYAAAEKSVDTINKLLPEVVKDAKALGASQEPSSRDALLKQVRALCDASRDVCASAETGQGLSQSASKFADASGRLVFVISPKTSTTKEQQVLDLSAAACGTASQLLSNVQQLSQQVGGDAGVALDRKGAKAADAAQALLGVAEKSASTISKPESQKSMSSAVDDLSSATQELATAWRQVPAGSRSQTLERELQDLEKILGQLRGTCQSAGDDEVKKAAEIKRLQFVKSAAGARKNLQAVDDELSKPAQTTALKQEDVAKKQNRLHQHIDDLNAAIAALMASTADYSKSDYAVAEKSVDTITKLLPEVVKDAKALGASQEPSSRDALLKQVRALCDASRDVCASAETGQDLSQSASKFADASGRLAFVVSSKPNIGKEQQVLDLSAAACSKASQLLSNVQHLSQQVGGDAGVALDRKGAKAADDAKELLEVVQGSASAISEPACQKSVLSSVDALSSSSQDLASTWRQLPAGPHNLTLERELQDLEKILGQLRGTCQSAGDDEVKKATEKKRLQFVKSAAGAMKNLQAADAELNKPVQSAPLKQEEVVKKQNRLQQHIEDLNAAIAALMASTADHSRPDYAAAEKSVDTINKLLPEVVKDAKALGASQEPSSRDALLKQVRALCDASRDVCASAETGQDLSGSASKFANASGRLAFMVSPKTNTSRVQQVLDLSAAACGTAAQLLSNVQQLSQEVGGDAGVALDRKGAKVADDSKALLEVAQNPALISDPAKQESIQSTVDALSSSTQDLASTWRRLPAGSHNHTLERSLQDLEKILGQLRGTCQSAIDDDVKKAAEIKRMQFVKSAASARRNLQAADDELNKVMATAPLSQADIVQKRNRLQEHIAVLSAAIAALLASTTDRSRSDYTTAEQSVDTISKLTTEVVKDAKSLGMTQDPSTREKLMKHVRTLCDASKDVCASAERGQGLSESASKFADASGKLIFVVSPNTNTSKEQQVLDLSTAACGTASQLLSNVQQLSQQIGGDTGMALDKKGAKAADDAKALLETAEKSAPTISDPGSQKSILSSVDALLGLSQDLANTWRQVPAGSRHQVLERELQDLERILGQLREACRSAGDQAAKDDVQRLKFVKTVGATKQSLKTADEELKKPAPTTPLTQEAAVDMQHQVQQELGQMSGAIAALVTATADRSHPDYATAEQSLGVVTLLLPLIIKDAKTLSPNQEPAGREALAERVQALCQASKDVCASAETGEGLPEAASRYANASGKLVYVINPRVDVVKGQQVLDLSAIACGTASQLLANVQHLTQQVSGPVAEDLDRKGATVADNAQALLTVAQVTAPSISDPHCQASILSSVDGLSASSQNLAQAWRKLPSGATKPLEQELEDLEKTLVQIKAAVKSDAGSKPKVRPEVPKRKSGTFSAAQGPKPRGPPPAVPRRNPRASIEITQEFLHTMRLAEDHAAEEKYRQQFLKAVDNAGRTIGCAENNLKEVYKSKSQAAGPKLSANQQAKKQKEMEEKLALANVNVAALVGANYADKIDFNTASKSINELPQLLSGIVEDGKSLSTSFTDKARQAFLDDMLQYCETTRTLCDTAKNDRQKLKEAAVNFGDKSARILYTVSSEADHDLEKQIISTAKDIGDSTSRLAAAGARLAPAPSPAAAAALDSTGALLYTAKLVAPAIHNSTCKEALLASAYKLSDNLTEFSNSWKPLESDPQQAKNVKELTEETNKLMQLLEHLRRCVRGQQVVEEKKEKLVVENTPLRVLACKIHQDAQKMSENSDLPVGVRHEYAQYCDAIRSAVGDVDDASLEARRAPHDINKYRELENAIQNLQMVILQNRPNRDGKGADNRIVDLREYIEDVAAEADKIIEIANYVETKQGKKPLEHIKEECQKIKSGASNSLAPAQYYGDDARDNDFEIDSFAQECESRVSDIGSHMRALEDDKASASLLPRYEALVESCNMLRFATKSGLATAQSAALDAALENLYNLDTSVAKTLEEDEQHDVTIRRRAPPPPPKPWARWRVCRAAQGAAQGAAHAPAPAPLAAYAAQELVRTQHHPDERDRLKKHLSKLIHLMKLLTVVTSKRVAMWQPTDDLELATISDQILQELEKPESGYGSSEHDHSILTPEYTKKLLSPNQKVKITGDRQQLQEKVQKTSSKLCMMSGNVVQSVASAASLARGAHAAADAAAELRAAAHALRTQDATHNKRIEEAAQEMSFATYNLLALSEYVSQRPDHQSSKMKLLEAVRQLNHSVNELTRVTCPANKLQQECEELNRTLQLQHSTLQATPRPACTNVYKDCVDALNSQQDVVDKLKNDSPMPRKQFVEEMGYITTAVCNSSDYAAQCAYLISISDENKAAAKEGLVDTHKLQKWLGTVEDTCVSLMHSANVENMKEEDRNLKRQVESLSEMLEESSGKVPDRSVRARLLECRDEVNTSADAVSRAVDALDGHALCSDGEAQIRKLTMGLLSALNKTESLVEDPVLQPQVSSIHPDTQAKSDEVLNNCKTLISKTQALVKQVKSSPETDEEMTWVMFKMGRDQVLESFEALLKSIRLNGNRCGILEYSIDVADEDAEMANKSYVQVQLDTANQWLCRPSCSAVTKLAGQQAAKNILDIGKKMIEDMKPAEKETTQQLIMEIEQLQTECSVKYDQEKYSLLMERLKELKKVIERDLVTRVVEELIEEEAPLEDLEILADTEKDASKRHYLLERKIAELLAQLGRVTRIARFVADAGSGSPALTNELKKCSDQSELLAPMLVKAAQERINKPNDKAAVDTYKSLLSKYADSLSRVRELCDQAVDPMDFVQTAGVMMERMREESSQKDDPRTCAKTSNVITKLANRVISVSMSSPTARRDPELQRALSDAKQRLRSVIPAPDTRASRLPDWRHTTAEILRTTGEVESVLGGENIFNKQPEPNQPIYSVALDLHASVREWSSRDNEIVAVARRMAVLMARLSDYMNTDKQRELLLTSKQIVQESHEVAYLAKKMAHECTDVRIKTNLLRVCERIPTISAQLKMLTAVKGSSLGHQGTKEDKEAMNMLVDNAQSLMRSIQDVVKGAASASVKIMSQHGPRNRWVRRNYY
ncbi:talin-1 isoform X2 [Manduca sexta]|uniref:talin-1 isoform X2 n=1 Tax=Manduca sexta TaxID=7130 RepID=UPI00188DE5B2|nr:talin-1 isoform X2 [Manduca sexta]